jgi:molybdopterin converting factor subunit 1
VIEVNVKLFAVIRDIVGKDELKISVDEGSVASTVLQQLAQQYPRLGEWKGHLRIAVNYEYVPMEHPLRQNDEVAIIPPVSGG